jgi:ABC-type transport system substrate-binding protein
VTCAVAREVVEKYGDDVGSHPVGTGPYRMAFWKRSSKMVFEKNPNFARSTSTASPSRRRARPGDPAPAEGQAPADDRPRRRST